MSLFRRERRTVESPSYPLTSQALIDLFGRPSASGVSVSEVSALNFSAVYRAVNTIAGQAAGLPLKTYRNNQTSGERTDTTSSWPLLAYPYPDVSPFLFWESAYWDLLLWGNSYSFKVRSELGGPYDIARLLRINPAQVTVRRDEGTARNPSGKLFVVDGNEADPFTPNDIMHIPGPGYDGLTGLSVVQCAREGIGVALAAEEASGKLFASGILASGILSTDQDLKQDQARGIAEAFKAAFAGLANAQKVPVLGRGVKFEQLTIPPADAQFLESREFQVVEIARWFGVTPALLMDATATMNWGEGAKQQFVTFTLNPWLKRVEQAVTIHLLPRGQFAEYTRAGLLESDLAAKTAAYATAVQFGWMTRNEVRALENLEQGPAELDVFLSPANLGGAANGQAAPGEDPTAPADDQEVPADVGT